MVSRVRPLEVGDRARTPDYAALNCSPTDHTRLEGIARRSAGAIVGLSRGGEKRLQSEEHSDEVVWIAPKIA